MVAYSYDFINSFTWFNFTTKIQYFFIQYLPFQKKCKFVNEDFGTYRFEITVKNHTLHIYRTLQLTDILLPPERYSDVVNFLKKVFDSDRAKVVLARE